MVSCETMYGRSEAPAYIVAASTRVFGSVCTEYERVGGYLTKSEKDAGLEPASPATRPDVQGAFVGRTTMGMLVLRPGSDARTDRVQLPTARSMNAFVKVWTTSLLLNV